MRLFLPGREGLQGGLDPLLIVARSLIAYSSLRVLRRRGTGVNEKTFLILFRKRILPEKGKKMSLVNGNKK